MSYEKFEPSASLAEQTYDAVEKSEDSGKVVIAGNVSPEEIVMHLPSLAEERDIPYTFVPDKEELGLAAGIQVQSAAIAVTKTGNAEDDIEDVAEKAAELLGKDEEE